TGLDLAGEIAGDAGYERHFAVGHAAENDGRALQFVLELVERLAHGFRIGTVLHRGQHLGALDFDRTAGEIVAGAGRRLGLEPRELLFRGARAVDELRDPGLELGHRRLERGGRAGDRRLARLHPG